MLAHGFKSDFDLPAQKRQLNGVTEAILNYYAHRETEEVVYKKIEEITSIASSAVTKTITGFLLNLVAVLRTDWIKE